jgi:hypothetical protein
VERRCAAGARARLHLHMRDPACHSPKQRPAGSWRLSTPAARRCDRAPPRPRAAPAPAGLLEELTRHEACREVVAKARSGGASSLKVLLALAVGDAAGPRVQAAGALHNVAADLAVGARARAAVHMSARAGMGERCCFMSRRPVWLPSQRSSEQRCAAAPPLQVRPQVLRAVDGRLPWPAICHVLAHDYDSALLDHLLGFVTLLLQAVSRRDPVPLLAPALPLAG